MDKRWLVSTLAVRYSKHGTLQHASRPPSRIFHILLGTKCQRFNCQVQRSPSDSHILPVYFIFKNDNEIRHAHPWMQTLEEDRTGAESITKGEDVEMPGNVCSIISFSVLVPDLAASPAGGSLRRLDFDEMKELHKVLAVAINERAIMLG